MSHAHVVMNRDNSPGLLSLTAAVLCIPSIVGAAILAALALAQQSRIPVYGWMTALFEATWMSAFLGAVYGPLLLPIAAAALLYSTRRTGHRAVAGWVLVAVGLIATAATYFWALDAVELP